MRAVIAGLVGSILLATLGVPGGAGAAVAEPRAAGGTEISGRDDQVSRQLRRLTARADRQASAAGRRGKVSYSEPVRDADSRLKQSHPRALGLSCTQQEVARVAGQVVVACSVPRSDAGSATRDVVDTTGPGARVRGLSVRVTGRGVRVLRMQGKKWRCSAAATCRRARVAPAGSGGQLLVTARVADRAARVRVAGRWQEQRLTGGGASRVRVKGWRTARAADRVRVTTARAARVRVQRVGPGRVPVVMDAGREQRVVRFTGQVTGTGAGQVSLRWRQVAGPRASWATQRSVASSAATEPARLIVPRLGAPRRLCVAAQARAQGARWSAPARRCLTVVPYRGTRSAADESGMRRLQRARAVSVVDAGPVRGLRTRSVPARLVGRSVDRATIGRAAVLRVRAGAPVRSVSWGIRVGRERVLSRTTTGPRLRFRFPAATPGGVAVVTATARLSGGRLVRPQTTMVVTPRATPPAGRAAAVTATAFGGYGIRELIEGPMPTAAALRAAAADDDDAAGGDGDGGDPADDSIAGDPGASFCELVRALQEEDSYQIELADGATITLTKDGVDLPASCDAAGAEVRYTGGRAALDELEVVGLAGTVSADEGLQISRGTVMLPDFWGDAVRRWGKDLKAPFDTMLQQWSPQRLDLGQSFTVPDDLFVGAPLDDDGHWQGLEGGVSVPALTLIPLPGDWSWDDSAQLAFEPATGLVTLSQRAAARDGSGDLIVSGRISTSGAARLQITVAGINVVNDKDGEVDVSGTGAITITREGDYSGDPDAEYSATTEFAPSLSLTATATGPDSSPDGYRLFQGLRLRSGSLSLDRTGLRVAMGLTMDSGSNQVALDAAGAFASTTDWEVDVSAEGQWNVVDDVTITDLHGFLKRSDAATSPPADGSAQADDGDARPRGSGASTTYAFDLSGTITGFSAGGLAISTITAEVTNTCPRDPDQVTAWFGAAGCDPGTVRLQVTGNGSVDLGGTTFTIDFGGWYDLQTLKYRVAGSVGDLRITDSLTLTKVQVVATNSADAGVCRRTESGTGSVGTVVSFIAEAQVLGKRVTFDGQYDSSGGGSYCVVGSVGDYALPGSGDLSVSDAVLAYSSTAATTQLHATDQAAGRTLALRPGVVTLNGAFRLPESVTGKLGPQFAGTAVFDASMTLPDAKSARPFGFDASVSYTLDSPLLLVGSATSTRLSLTGADLAVTYQGGALSLILGGRGDLTVPLHEGQPDSVTPLYVAIAIEVGKDSGAELKVSASVTPDDKQRGVQNAFGQEDLTVWELDASFTISANPKVQFNARVALPGRWTDKIRIVAGTEVSLKFEISEASPCLQFSVGDSTSAGAAWRDSDAVVDIAGQGVVLARYMNLRIAPATCTFDFPQPGGGSKTVTLDGFGLDFDGRVAGAAVRLHADVTLPTEDDPEALTVTASLDVGAFDLGPVTIGDTHAAIDINSREGRYHYAFSGSIDIDILGESQKQAVSVEYGVDAKKGTITAEARAQFRLGLGPFTAQCQDGTVAGVATPGFRLAFSYQQDKGLDHFEVALNCQLRVLGQKLGIAGDLEYTNGSVTRFAVAISISLNFLIGKVSGQFAVDYQRDTGTDDNGATVVQNGYRLRIWLAGSLRVWPFKPKNFSMTLYEKSTKSDPIPYSPAPPVSTTGKPPYRWLATSPGCLDTYRINLDTNLPTGPVRCADAQTEPFTDGRDSELVDNYWVDRCTMRNDRPCDMDLTHTVVWNPSKGDPNPPAQLKREVDLSQVKDASLFGLRTYAGDGGGHLHSGRDWDRCLGTGPGAAQMDACTSRVFKDEISSDGPFDRFTIRYQDGPVTRCLGGPRGVPVGAADPSVGWGPCDSADRYLEWVDQPRSDRDGQIALDIGGRVACLTDRDQGVVLVDCGAEDAGQGWTIEVTDQRPYGEAATTVFHPGLSGDGTQSGWHRWPACRTVFGATVTAPQCDIYRTSLSDQRDLPAEVRARALASYLIRMQPEGRATLSTVRDRPLYSRGDAVKFSLDPDRTVGRDTAGSLLDGQGDSAVLFRGQFLNFADSPGTPRLAMSRDGDLTMQRGGFNWRAHSDSYVDPNATDPAGSGVVAAILDDDCRLKLVDDTGVVRLETRNARVFGGRCALVPDDRDLPGAAEAVFRLEQYRLGDPADPGNADVAVACYGGVPGFLDDSRQDVGLWQDGSTGFTPPGGYGRCATDPPYTDFDAGDANWEVNPLSRLRGEAWRTPFADGPLPPR